MNVEKAWWLTLTVPKALPKNCKEFSDGKIETPFQPCFLKVTVTEQHIGDGTWMYRAPLQHWGTTGTRQLRTPGVSPHEWTPTMEVTLPVPAMQLGDAAGGSSACRPGHPAEPESTSPAEGNGISCMGRGRSQGPRQPCCAGRTQGTG